LGQAANIASLAAAAHEIVRVMDFFSFFELNSLMNKDNYEFPGPYHADKHFTEFMNQYCGMDMQKPFAEIQQQRLPFLNVSFASDWHYRNQRQGLLRFTPQLEQVTLAPDMEMLPTELSEFLRQFRQRPVASHKLQKLISQAVHKAAHESVIQNCPKEAIAHYLTNCHQDSNRFLTMSITNRKHLLPKGHLSYETKRILGLPYEPWIYHSEEPVKCPMCKDPNVDLRENTNHGGHCEGMRRLAVTSARHDPICAEIFAIVVQQGYHAAWQPRLDNGKQTDVGTFINGAYQHLDVSVVDPTAPSNVRLGQHQLGLANSQLTEKHKLYDETLAKQGETLQGMIFEPSGAMATETSKFLKQLAKAGEIRGRSDKLSFEQIKKQIAIALATGNALIQIEYARFFRNVPLRWTQTAYSGQRPQRIVRMVPIAGQREVRVMNA
jgi:hypothetical protein